MKKARDTLPAHDPELLQKAADQVLGLAIDVIGDRASGHLGLPLGCAEIGAVLFGDLLNVISSEPLWLNRDRFVLSAGHGSMFLYAWPHLAGFEVSLDDVKAFRTKSSATPGHPEFGMTPGVECTTGPLGQGGGANAVGSLFRPKGPPPCSTRPATIFSTRVSTA